MAGVENAKARQYLFEDGRELLTSNMKTALVAYLLQQRYEIDSTNIERVMSHRTTIEKNEELVSFLELKKDDPDNDVGVVLLECLRLAQPLLAESFIPIDHVIVWFLSTPESAAIAVNFLENSRSLKMAFGPAERERSFLYRRCCCFKFVSTVLIITYPERDGVETYVAGVMEASHRWSPHLRLLVYSGHAVGVGVPIGTTVKVDPEHLENFPQPITLPPSCDVVNLPCSENMNPPCETTQYIADPYLARLASAVSCHSPVTPCFLVSTVSRIDLERITPRARQRAVEASAEVCLEGLLASLGRVLHE